MLLGPGKADFSASSLKHPANEANYNLSIGEHKMTGFHHRLGYPVLSSSIPAEPAAVTLAGMLRLH